MNMSKRSFQFAMWMGACVTLASTASAQANPFATPTAPSVCASDSRNKTGYNTSVTAGSSRINAVWNSAAVNHNLDNLSNQYDLLMTSLQHQVASLVGSSAITQYTKCRAQGYIDGYVFRLFQLFGQCIGDGADWGQFTASLYCDLALNVPGLGSDDLIIRTPVQLCGNLFELTCEDTHQYVAEEGDFSIHDIVQQYFSVHDFTPATFTGCKQYTRDAYLSAYQTALNNDCTYAGAQ
jgi:hypothetical protein